MAMLGAGPITAPGWTSQPKQDIAIIDCDVHQTVRKLEDLEPYLPQIYREQVADQGFLLPTSGYFSVPRRAVRTDLMEGCDVNTNCWDYNLLRDQHLTPWNIDYALLTGADMYTASVVPDPNYAAALCRAFNDWTLENWIARDERLKMSMAISTSDPTLAVQEIERIGDHADLVGILLPSGARIPYGNRFYHPIWEACQSHGLTVFIHPGAEGTGMAGPPTGVGYPTYYLETRMARSQMAMAHCASLICEGVFEKFPKLRFALLELDQFWVPGFLWKMDADWKSLREQTPWLKRLPSEYFRQHIRIGSQPFAEPERPEHLIAMLEAMYAKETLIYCSDWPHFDWDDPATTFPKLPEFLHRRIFAENVLELFRL